MPDATINVLSSALVWLGKIFVVVFQVMWDTTIDLIIAASDLSLSAIDVLISSVPAPQFLTQYLLQSLIGQMGSDILYSVSILNIPQGLAMLDAGAAFRLFVRKFFTLGQR